MRNNGNEGVLRTLRASETVYSEQFNVIPSVTAF